MPSPFPGMDPFIESQGFWPDFHFRMLARLSEALSSALPPAYAALLEERVSLVDLGGRDVAEYRPDVTVTREARERGVARTGSAVATLEAVAVPLPRLAMEEVTDRWIEIKRLPGLSLVTVIELLSPANKTGQGRARYLEKRHEFLGQEVNLVEIDLLLGGQRLPMGGPLPPGDYFALVSRAESRESSDVYAWSIRRPLPTIPIPLFDPDPDIPLDLAPLFAQTYAQARYAQLLRYAQPSNAQLSAADRAWVGTVVAPEAL